MTAPTGHRSAGPGSQSAPGALRVLLDLVSGLVGLTSQVVVSPPRPRLTPLLELPGPFREIVEFAPDAIIVHVQGRYVYVNQAAVRLFGARDAADLIGTSLVDRVHPDDREFARDRIRQSQSGGELAPVTDLRVLRMDGSVVDVEVRASRFHWDDRPAVQAVIREISDRKRGEQLQAAVYRIAQAADQAVTLEDLYREIHTIVSGVMPADNFFIAYYDRQKDILSFPYFVDQVDTVPGPRPAGHTLTEYVLRTGKSLLCTEEVDAALQASGEVELVGEPSAIWLGVPLLSCDKTIGAMVVQHYSDPQAYGERERQMLEFVSSQVAQAIERKSQLLARAEAETALRDSEERYRNLVENAPVGIYRTTPDGRILSANPTIVRMLGYNSFEELARFNLEREGRAAGYRRKRFAEMLEQDGVVRGLESAWRRRDGAEIFVRENAQAVRGAGGEILYYDGTVEDITERRRVEESERELRALAEALRDTAALLNSTLNQDQVMDLMLSNLGRVVPHDASSIMLVENGIGRIVRTRGYAERGADAEIRAVEFRIDDYPLLREIAQGGRPAVIPDTRAFPAWARLPHTDWIRSHASAPLRVRGETIGFVGVGSTIPGFFKEQHGARLQAFADQASIALENARLLSETERRANQFAALYETAQELAYPRDLAIRLDGIVDRARALLDAQGAFIYLYDEARDELALTIEKGMGIPSGLRLKSGEGLAGRVAETRQPQLVENYSAWENRSGAYEGRDLRAIVEVPMIHAGELLGVLGVSEMEGSTRRFGEEDLQLLTLFAGQAASALKSARLLDETGTRAQQLALLYDAGLTLNGVLEPRAQLEFLLKIALRALHADHAEFFRYEPSSRELSLELGVDAAAADPSAQAARSNAADESGPLAWVLKHRVPLNVPAFPDDPRTRTMNGGLAAGLWTPVERTGEVRGVLAVFSKRRDAFSLQDERLLVLFANQAAVALENARLYTELAESLAMTTQFYHVTGQVLQADSFQETAHLITQALREALNADFTSIALVDEEGQSTFEHGIGYPEGFFDRTAGPPDEMAARAWRTGQPVVADNPEQFPAAVRELGVRAGICLPLAGDTGRLGLLFVQYRRPHVFAERELKTLALFANQASLAMRRVRLLEQARARAAKLAVLNRIAGAASRSEDLDALLNRIYQEVRDTVSTDGFFIALCDESTNELDFRLSVDQDEHLPPARLPRERVPLTSFALDSRQTTFIPDILADSTGNRYPRMTLIGSGNDPRTWLGVPLHVGDKIIGLLSVQSYRPNAYTPEEQQLIETIADQAAIAIQNARLFDETRQRLAEMEAVNRISTGVRVAASLEEMLPGLLSETLAAVDASDGMLAFYDAPARQLAIGAARGWFSALPTGLSTEEGVLGRVFTEGAIDLGREPGAEPFAAGLSTPPGCTRVVIPILAGQDRVGVLAVLLAHPRDVTLSQVRLLETIAEIAGTTVQRIRLSGKIEDAFLDTALALARIVDERDSETSGHSDRLAEIALWLASALDLSPQEQEDLRLAARLHDIGKSGVPDAILLKPDSLGPAEWSILKKHPAIGAEIIQPLQRLRGVAPLVLHHQERYDGTGYPEGLAGEGIPLGARILALADAVSAMVDGRIYRKARSWAEVRAELERCAGNQFDPRLVDLLLQHWPGLQVGPTG